MKLLILLISCLILLGCSIFNKAPDGTYIIKQQAIDKYAYIQVIHDYKPPQGTKNLKITSFRANKDSLFANVEFRGGCELHYFELVSPGSKATDSTVQIYLWDVTTNDNCEALVQRKLSFNISNLIEIQNLPIYIKLNDHPKRVKI